MNKAIMLKTPSIIIQDHKSGKYYHLDSGILEKFSLSEEVIVDSGIHFIIPDNDLVDVVDSYENDYTSDKPTIYVHYIQEEKIFKIEFSELEDFEISKNEFSDISERTIAFIIPTNDDLIESTPAMSPAMLQSNTKIPTVN